MNYKDFLKTQYLEKEFEEVLVSEIDILLGVSPGAMEALKAVDIYTVFDLATSRIFNNAWRICNRGNDNLFSKYNLVPSEVILGRTLSGELDELYQEKIEKLDGIGVHNGGPIREGLSVDTIRDLAQWPPFQNIRLYLIEQIEQKVHFEDPEIPQELLPQFNQFPTEKVFYSVYLIDDISEDSTESVDFSDLEPLSGPIDLTTLNTDGQFLGVRTGYILRFEQGWTTIGLALGNLLHSITLAPGESTRIAMVDWTRRQGVRTTEDISQIEALSNSLMQTRSISEVTSAVAREAQSGFSKMDANSTVSNNGYSSYGLQNPKETIGAMLGGAAIGGGAGAAAGGMAGVGIGAAAGAFGGAAAGMGIGSVPGFVVGGLVGAGAGGAIGAGSGALIGGTAGGAAAGLASANFGARSDNSSNTKVDVVTTTSSTGQRELSASMAQNILDRTQQHSSASRNRKASIVQEVRQEEKEQITTRVLTNYNHMHALTMNYFEVVQLYSAKVKARELTRCLYVPFVKISWSDALVERYRGLLIQNALTWDILQSLSRPSNLSLLINNTTNALKPEDITAIMVPSSNFQLRFNEFVSQVNVEPGSNVIDPLFLPSALEIKKIETSLANIEVFFELVDGRRIPSKITNTGQTTTTTTITFSFKRRTLNHNFNILDVNHTNFFDEGVSTTFTLPVENNMVNLVAFGYSERLLVDFNRGMIDIPQTMIFDSTILNSPFRQAGWFSRPFSVPFQRHDETHTEVIISYVDKRITEIKKIIVQVMTGLGSNVDPARITERANQLSNQLLEIKFTFLLNGREVPLVLPFRFKHDRTSLLLPSISLECDLIQFNHQVINQEVIKHLNFNSDYYTQKIFQSLGELEYASIISQYSYRGVPLLNLVDIKPVALSGNYIIFKAKHTDDKSVDAWKRANRYDKVCIEIIPLGTGGVFGEAVQGRANSAEKLDITRFWNWQDSPIPITAPDIAPVQSGSRATAADVRPGSFDPSLVANMTPGALPDPQSMPAILNTLASGNMFRDMSGIVETAQLAQKSLEEAMKGATETGSQSKENLQKGLEFTKEIAGKVIKMAGDYGTLLANTGFGALTGLSSKTPAGAGGNEAAANSDGGVVKPNLGSSNPSVAGAIVNQGKDMDKRSKQADTPQDDSSSDPNFETPKMMGENEQNAFDNITGKSKPHTTNKGSLVEVTVKFQHELSGTLDGEFNFEFVGPGVIKPDFTTRTSRGLGMGTVILVTGQQYSVQMAGNRTRLPTSMDSIAHIPVIDGNPAFDFDLSRHITTKDVELEKNFDILIPRGKKRISLTLTATEVTKELVITAKVTGSGSVQGELEAAVEPELADLIKIGKVSAKTVVTASAGGETTVQLPIEYKYLTGSFTVDANVVVV